MKALKILPFLVLSLLMLNMQCDEDDDIVLPNCDFDVIIDQNEFEEPSPSQYSITNAELINDCLEITITSSGCDGNTWEVELFSSAPITNGFDTTASLSLKLVNPEVCLAVISQTYSFDVNEIGEGSQYITLSLEGWPENFTINN